MGTPEDTIVGLGVLVLIHDHMLQVNRVNSIDRENLVRFWLIISLSSHGPVHSVSQLLSHHPFLVDVIDRDALDVGELLVLIHTLLGVEVFELPGPVFLGDDLDRALEGVWVNRVFL